MPSNVPAKWMTTYIKYPRTHHLPWSPGADANDQFMHDVSVFEGQRVVITKKMDGENTTMYSEHIHARSIDSRLGGDERTWVKQFWSTIAHEIPANWRICGENLWAVHSIYYDDLLSYFYGFSVWNEQNTCLSWDETLLYFELLGVVPVPVLYDGNWNEEAVMALAGSMDFSTDEGYVVRLASSFPYCQFKDSVAKFVRKGHVQTTKKWRKEIIPNGLAKLS